MTLVLFSSSSTVNADFFGDAADVARDLTQKAKNITKDATGDWCSGKKYFSEMSYSDRLKDGSKDLLEKIGKLNDTSSKMEYDIKFHIESGVGKTIRANKTLISMNNKLCKDALLNNYSVVDYNGSSLRDKGEILAQIRMNLATTRSNNKVIKFYNKQKTEFNFLNSRVKDKANELAVLKKNFENLSDPRSKNKTSSYFESVVGNACTAIGDSEDLVMEYKNKDSTTLFRNISQNHQTKTISEKDVTAFMNTCSGSDDAEQKSLLGKTKELFGF